MSCNLRPQEQLSLEPSRYDANRDPIGHIIANRRVCAHGQVEEHDQRELRVFRDGDERTVPACEFL